MVEKINFYLSVGENFFFFEGQVTPPHDIWNAFWKHLESQKSAFETAKMRPPN